MNLRSIFLFFTAAIFISGTDPSGDDLVRASTKELLVKGGSVSTNYIRDKDTVHNEYQVYLLFQRNGSNCSEKEFHIHPKKVKAFVDSMRAAGFNSSAKFLNKISEYNVKLLLDPRITKSDDDKNYIFSYTIKVSQIKGKKEFRHMDEMKKEDKELIMKAFQKADYTVKELYEEAGTGIIRIKINSVPFFEIFPGWEASRIFYL